MVDSLRVPLPRPSRLIELEDVLLKDIPAVSAS